MFIKKGTKLKVNHSRKGTYYGIAHEDFDTETTEFYPIALAKGEVVKGIASAGYLTPHRGDLGNTWIEGEVAPCRKGLATIEVVE